MRTIAIINQKGGCGKTTTAINLASQLAAQGRRTLLIDMDPQSHCAAGLGVPESRIEMDIGDAMLAVGPSGVDAPRLLWRVARNLDLAPSRTKLAGLEASRGGLADLLDREKRLAAVVSQFKHEYDVVCVDCPPTIGLLTYNALACADLVLIPVETSYFALQGATKQVSTVRTLSRRLGVQLPVWILPTIHEAQSPVAEDLLGELQRRFKDRVAPVVIRRDLKLREAASFGQPVREYAPDSAGTADHATLAKWLGELLVGPLDAGADTGEADVTVPPVTARFLAEKSPDRAADKQSVECIEAKAAPNRAEDVARRAQEFLRRVALGKAGTGVQPFAPVTALTPEGQAAEAPVPMVMPTGALRLVEAEVKPVTAPGTARLLGARETNQGVLFVQPLVSGQVISIAGSFNNWSATSHVMKRNVALGVHELCLRLPPGRFVYRLVIDGQWTADPYNNECEPNPFGGTNSVCRVGEGAVVQSA
ncbi:MAG: AAA family ATPase [Phycisphaerales bacterium]|nr:AAA family ATPase [Phycisphaerales bacterium]